LSKGNASMISIDFRFHEVKYELWALGEYIDMVERQLPIVERQEIDRVTSRLRAEGLEHDEAERSIASQTMVDLIENVAPRYFRGPILVALWAIYESASVEIAEYLREKKSALLALDDIRGNSDLDKTQKYFNKVLNFPLYTNDQAGNCLRELNLLRNELAHSNGRFSRIRPARRGEIERLATRGVTVSQTDTLLFNNQFVRETFETVDSSLRDLITRVTSSY